MEGIFVDVLEPVDITVVPVVLGIVAEDDPFVPLEVVWIVLLVVLPLVDGTVSGVVVGIFVDELEAVEVSVVPLVFASVVEDILVVPEVVVWTVLLAVFSLVDLTVSDVVDGTFDDKLEPVEVIVVVVVLGIVVEVVAVVPVVVIWVALLNVEPSVGWTVSVVVEEVVSSALALRRRRYRTAAAVAIVPVVPAVDVLLVPLVVGPFVALTVSNEVVGTFVEELEPVDVIVVDLVVLGIVVEVVVVVSVVVV